MFNAAKAGHTGTLDPMATGLLPLCFGEATKFAGELLDADKSYRATLYLGVTTDSGDADGRLLKTRPVTANAAVLQSVVDRFRGPILQIPPMYSALKRDGKALYEYARQGIELERQPRQVTVHALKLLSFDGVRAVIDVDCSKGTYVRVLAADIGEMLGCGAHLSALRRTRIAGLDVSAAITLEELESLGPDKRDLKLSPADALLASLARVDADQDESARLMQGQAIRRAETPGQRYRLYGSDGAFLGLGELAADGWLYPRRLIASQ
jgi:tRNA pseudouridine55 synthase